MQATTGPGRAFGVLATADLYAGSQCHVHLCRPIGVVPGAVGVGPSTPRIRGCPGNMERYSACKPRVQNGTRDPPFGSVPVASFGDIRGGNCFVYLYKSTSHGGLSGGRPSYEAAPPTD